MTTEIENTRRQMYTDLKRFESMVGSTHLFKTLQDSLEAHLEELRVVMKNREDVGQAFSESLGRIVTERDSLIQKLSAMTEERDELRRNNYTGDEAFIKLREERDQIQQRLHAIDHAYLGSQTALGVAGDCIRDTQAVNREYQRLIKERDDQIVALKGSLEASRGRVASLLNKNKAVGEEMTRVQGIARQHLDDCRSAEKLSDELDEKLRSAQSVIGQQEQLITGQRLAIADLFLKRRSHEEKAKEFVDNLEGLPREMARLLGAYQGLCVNPAHHVLCKCDGK